MRYYKNILKIIIATFVIVILCILTANYVVKKSTESKISDNIEDVPYNKAGLLLGTSKYLSNGRMNLYYRYRLDAAVKLYKSGKIEYILVSGDNSTSKYNEPVTIKNDLVEMGIPDDRIYLDYAGFRTLDSIIRCKLIFGQNSVTVISQQFHNERAVYIACAKDIRAFGYNAPDVNIQYGFKTKTRELFARVKMFMDLMFHKQPKFLGEKIEIK